MDITPIIPHATATINSYEGDMAEMTLHLIELFIEKNPHDYSQPKFTNIIFDNVSELLHLTLGEMVDITDKNVIENIYENISYYFKTCGTPRSYAESLILHSIDHDLMEKKLIKLAAMPQPVQKSKEWFIDRGTMLTASTIWEALDTQASQNRLICRKCVPIDLNRCFRVNINSSMHHGQKYEPISVMLYENLYKTTIKEFGCIRHREHTFLGASPDGINMDKNNERYGRMLEIKNIVNRDITGIPKKAYWVQMQLQMEVCDLEECDFLETRFKEYDDEQAFLKDGGFDCSKIKGIILCFHGRQGPIYKYPPFFPICEETKCNDWMEKCMESNTEMTWVRNIYWSLDEYSCVLVPRNRPWFKSALSSFKKIWETILYEREHGYEHRKPKKRDKIKNIVLKVRTESFDTTIIQEVNAPVIQEVDEFQILET
jgi:putative phage-type endonuclease